MSDATPQFAERLRAAIESRGVTMVWLRDRLTERGTPVSVATLSYWRSGRRNPEGEGSLAAIAALEDLLGVSAGHLASQVLPRRRGTRDARPDLRLDDDGVRAAVAEVIDALGVPVLQSSHVLSAQVVGDVDVHGRLVRITNRVVARVTSGIVAETPYLEVAPEPTDVRPVVTPGPGRRVARTFHHPGRRVSGWVFALPSPLEPPATTVAEWTVDYPEGYPTKTEHSYLLAREAREVLVWIRFHPDRLPSWCEGFTGTDRWSIALGSGTTSHVLRQRLGPDRLGIRWGFADR